MSEPLLEYRKIGLLATCIGNERIRLDTDGSLSYASNSRECEPGERWSAAWRNLGKVERSAVEDFVRVIRESGLLQLPPVTIAATAEGGQRQELVVRVDGSVRCYAVQNVEQPVFDQVVQQLRGMVAGAG